jgi:hypothetical protein
MSLFCTCIFPCEHVHLAEPSCPWTHLPLILRSRCTFIATVEKVGLLLNPPPPPLYTNESLGTFLSELFGPGIHEYWRRSPRYTAVPLTPPSIHPWMSFAYYNQEYNQSPCTGVLSLLSYIVRVFSVTQHITSIIQKLKRHKHNHSLEHNALHGQIRSTIPS